MTDDPEDRVAQATKLLRERIPLVLKFESGAAYAIMVGVEDLARDVLALAAPALPLPDEIAGLANFLEETSEWISARWICDGGFIEKFHKAADALRALAQENERLQERIELWKDTAGAEAEAMEDQKSGWHAAKERIRELETEGRQELRNNAEAYRKRIRELEAERDAYRDRTHELDRQIETLRELRKHDEVERDATRAKTIKECLAKIPGGNICDPQEIADRIRALAQTDEGKTETGK